MRAGRVAGHSKDSLDRAKRTAKITHESGGFPRSTVWIHPDGKSDISSRRNDSTTGQAATTATTGLTSGNAPSGVQSSHTSNPATTATTQTRSPASPRRCAHGQASMDGPVGV
jgi:hypothetical protein